MLKSQPKRRFRVGVRVRVGVRLRVPFEPAEARAARARRFLCNPELDANRIHISDKARSHRRRGFSRGGEAQKQL